MVTRVGFIGLGIMGKPMAHNVLKAGYPLTVYNRTRTRAKELVEKGAREGGNPREVAEQSDIVITMVTDTPDVEEVLLGEAGVIHGSRPGMVVIDMSTISPDATRDMASRLEEEGVDLLDAPVSGGDVGAINGTLTIMVGGKKEVFPRCEPILATMGKRITYAGPSGAGQTIKLCNQILCAVNMVAACEALSLAYRGEVDPETTLRVVTGGAGNSWALENLGPKIIERDFRPGFMVKLIQKDLHLVLELARRLDLPLAGTALASQLFRSIEAHGGGDQGTQAMIQALERLGNYQLHKG